MGNEVFKKSRRCGVRVVFVITLTHLIRRVWCVVIGGVTCLCFVLSLPPTAAPISLQEIINKKSFHLGIKKKRFACQKKCDRKKRTRVLEKEINCFRKVIIRYQIQFKYFG